MADPAFQCDMSALNSFLESVASAVSPSNPRDGGAVEKAEGFNRGDSHDGFSIEQDEDSPGLSLNTVQASKMASPERQRSDQGIIRLVAVGVRGTKKRFVELLNNMLRWKGVDMVFDVKRKMEEQRSNRFEAMCGME